MAREDARRSARRGPVRRQQPRRAPEKSVVPSGRRLPEPEGRETPRPRRRPPRRREKSARRPARRPARALRAPSRYGRSAMAEARRPRRATVESLDLRQNGGGKEEPGERARPERRPPVEQEDQTGPEEAGKRKVAVGSGGASEGLGGDLGEERAGRRREGGRGRARPAPCLVEDDDEKGGKERGVERLHSPVVIRTSRARRVRPPGRRA